MKTNSEYKKLVDRALKRKIEIAEKDQIYIMNLFKEVSEELGVKGIKAKKSSLSEAWIRNYKRAVDKNIQEMNIRLSRNVTESVKTAAEIAASTHSDFLIKTAESADSAEMIKRMFSNPSKEAVNEIISGGFNKDKRGLNQRIWGNSMRLQKNIDYIIQKGILAKKSAYELAKDLAEYVNPEVKKDWAWKSVYPNACGTRVDYNAQRLARTAVNHSYYLSNIRSSKENPYVESMHWELSHSHFERQILRFGEDECDDYANQDDYGLGQGNFPVDKTPVPHPLCLCVQYCLTKDTLDK